MPELPPSKRTPAEALKASTRSRYAELHCRSSFSFLEGASHPDELVNRAAALNLHALAVTDRNSLAGVVRAHVAAKEAGLKLLIGAEIVPVDSPPLLLLATDRASYSRLSTLITVGRRVASKGECHLTFQDVCEYSEGLLALIPLNACLSLPSSVAVEFLTECRSVFEGRCYTLAELTLGPDDDYLLQKQLALAGQVDLPVAAANDVHYHVAARQPLQDVVTAIRNGCRVDQLGALRFPNAERHLKSAAQMQDLFTTAPGLVTRTCEIADRCHFSLDELKYEYPEELCPSGQTPLEYLTQLTSEGAETRYPDGTPGKVQRLIAHELSLIAEMHYEPYFLTVWDLVRFARSRDILCQGRGSAANSAVCFCLGVTEVDPDRIDVLFERFVSKERGEPPDIDIDFEHERREEVLQYLFEKYGRDRAAMTGVVITYRTRSAVRDVGKALGFSLDRIDRIAKSLDHLTSKAGLDAHFEETGVDLSTSAGQRFVALVREILDFPRHLSQHVGGMVMTRGRVSDFVPIENAAMSGRTVVQWDKNDLDALGILKVDCLALGMLSAIRKCLDLISRSTGRQMTLQDIPAEDPLVYAMISRADTIGVFQIESRAQMSMLPRLRPRCFYDLVIEVALVRPGPIQGDMVHPYLRRRCGEEPVEYPDDRIREVLHRTLGVPIFQEQAMRLAVVAGGFTPGEADQLRRAMGAWRKQGVIEQFRRKLINGMLDNGYTLDFAARVFRQIQGFGEYGFPESHAASFALLVYVSAWLKKYYPSAFAAAIINSQPMGFYAPSQLVSDAERHGVTINPIDVNFSEWDCSLEANANGEPHLRLGFRMINGLPRDIAETILRIRNLKSFESFDDFRFRTRLSSTVLSKLSEADAFQSLKLSRRPAMWDALPDQSSQPLFDGQPDREPETSLPAMSAQREVLDDYRTTGLSLKAHPLSLLRGELQRRGVITAAALIDHPVDRKVRVAGLVLLRQHPGSANGITFVTIEDETGTTNLIVHPNVWNRFRVVARTASALLVRGILQREATVIHVVVDHLDDLSETLGETRQKSRDFR